MVGKIRTGVLVGVFAGFASAQLRITTTSVPKATQYQSYIAALSATGGTPPYNWTVVTSTYTSLPEGMDLNSATGVVSAATVYGQGGYAVTIAVSDTASPSPNFDIATLNFGVDSDPSYGGCQMFPADSIYNQRIDQLPLDTNPSHQTPASYLGVPLHPDFGLGYYPAPGGIPFLRVPSGQQLGNLKVSSQGPVEGPGTYLWPVPSWPNVPTEGTAYGRNDTDHHILILQSSVNNIAGPQTGNCTLYEMYGNSFVPAMFNRSANTWYVTGAVHYDLGTNEIAASEATLGDGASDLAGIPIFPLLIRYSEVADGVRHPLRIAFPPPTNSFVWPATGCCTGSGPPLGLLYRLKAGVNWQATCPSASYPQAATVLKALQQYGAYMSSQGGAGYLGGVPDDRWDDNDLACVGNFRVSDLEVVDNSYLEVSGISGQTKPYVVPGTLPDGSAGASYGATLAVVGGTPGRIQWIVSSGSLPPGLVLDPLAGMISGLISSTTGNPFSFGVTARDMNSGYSSLPQAFTINVKTATSTLLSISKTHTGVFGQGQLGAGFSVIVSNSGIASSGPVVVTEMVPSGMKLVSMTGTGWTCPDAGTTCTRSDSLGTNASYLPINVVVNVASDANSPLVNRVSVAWAGTSTVTASDTVSISSRCDLNQDGSTTVADVQRAIDEALGLLPATDDLNRDGVVNIADAQIVRNATLGLTCMAQ